MLMTTPIITVLMPVYNCKEYVAEAVESILGQTFADCEFIIVNDGSTDGTGPILDEFARRDHRIRLLHQENRGVTSSLNRAISLAKGRYIARMDADDVSLPQRFQAQVSFMEREPRVAICGTSIRIINGTGRMLSIRRYPTTMDGIRCLLFSGTALAHPTFLMRTALLKRLGQLYYDPDFQCGQDYDLLVRVAERAELANLPGCYLAYRVHEAGVSARQHALQMKNTDRIRFRQLAKLGVSPSEEEMTVHKCVLDPVALGFEELVSTEYWMNRLVGANRMSGRYCEVQFMRFLADQWFTLCNLSTSLGDLAWKTYFQSQFGRRGSDGVYLKLRFGLKCLLRRGRR